MGRDVSGSGVDPGSRIALAGALLLLISLAPPVGSDPERSLGRG